MKALRIIIPVVAIALLVAVFSISDAAGGGPGDAVWADGSPQTVMPHSALWFKFDYNSKNRDVLVTLAADDALNLRLDIYPPQAVQAWLNGESLKAIGNGSPMPDHTLGWAGRFNFGGTIYAVVYNDRDAPVTVQVQAAGENVVTQVVTPVPTATPLPNPFQQITPIGGGISGKLAFLDAQGGSLYTVNGDGSNLQRISFGMDPQWNHTGTALALARQGPVPGIFTINADGSSERLLFGATEPRSPDWSPDDSRLVFTRQTGVKGGGSVCFGSRCFDVPADSQWKLGLVNTSDAGYKDVPTTNHAFTPSWNPVDATKIAYNDTAIGVIVTSTEGTPSLTPIIGDLRTGSEFYDPLKVLSPQYSPDGSKIVMMVAQPPTWQIAVANADGSDRHLLTSMNILDFKPANNVAPVWSPDGKQILFLSDRNGKWEFFLMNADGSSVQQVLKDISDQIPLTYSFQGERMYSWTR